MQGKPQVARTPVKGTLGVDLSSKILSSRSGFWVGSSAGAVTLDAAYETSMECMSALLSSSLGLRSKCSSASLVPERYVKINSN